MLRAGDLIDIPQPDGTTRQYRLRPVVAQHLCDLERDALRHYKRQYLATFAENADLLGNGAAGALIEKKMEEIARWDIQDLPQKTAYDIRACPVTPAAREWAAEHAPDVETGNDRAVMAVLMTGLDNGELSSEDVERMTGRRPRRGKVRYDQWWVTTSMEGMIGFVSYSVEGASRGDVASWPPVKLIEAVRVVETLTAADLKNG